MTMDRKAIEKTADVKHPSRTRVTKRASGKAPAMPTASATFPAPKTGKHIHVWSDDPLDGVPVKRPVPEMSASSLKFNISGPATPPGVYEAGSSDFRYWTAAESLRRCAEFWLARTPGLAWHGMQSIPIILDAGLDLNAFYDRQSLTFFHETVQGKTVFSGESPDIVCHEMGHAILDGFKPALWNVASQEVAAFHESFGDISAILAALQLPEVRKSVLHETGGRMNRSSRISRVAEQLGAAIRVGAPDAVDPDCLRNASNRFSYQSPMDLKANGPASTLSAAPHSFSRVFTGAFLDTLAGSLTLIAARPNAPTEEELLQVSEYMGDVLMSAIRNASVVSNFYSQIAAGMVAAAAELDPRLPRVFKAAFVKRDILSLQSATSVESLAAATGMFAHPTTDQYQPSFVAFDGAQFGLGEKALLCETPSQPRRIAASAAATRGGSAAAIGSELATRGFVEDLFKRGKVDCSEVADDSTRLDPAFGLKTHRLARVDGNAVLQRVLCDCGVCHH
jgi:hypothetical protein